MPELIYVVTGIDHAGIDHRLETEDAMEAQQYHLKLIGMAREAERREQNWQQWPEIGGRPTLGTPKPANEVTNREPVRGRATGGYRPGERRKQYRQPYD